jgi:hypothetical protein
MSIVVVVVAVAVVVVCASASVYIWVGGIVVWAVRLLLLLLWLLLWPCRNGSYVNKKAAETVANIDMPCTDLSAIICNIIE